MDGLRLETRELKDVRDGRDLGWDTFDPQIKFIDYSDPEQRQNVEVIKANEELRTYKVQRPL